MLTRLVQAARPRARELGLLGALVAAALVGMGGALAESAGVVVVATAAGIVTDTVLRVHFDALNRPLTRVSAGMPTRRLARAVPVVLYGALTAGRGTTVVLSLAAFSLVALGVVAEAARLALWKVDAEMPVSRNLPGHVRRSRSRSLSTTAAIGAGLAEVLVLVPVCLGAGLALVTSLAGGGVVVAAVFVALLLLEVRATTGPAARALRVDGVAAAVDAAAPTVLLVFSGDAASTYQVNTWLPVVEALDEPALVVLRDHAVFDALDRTRLPVVCVPDGQDLMSLRFPTARVALFPTNVANNIHVLRIPHILSAFVGHGDSDKNASYNPYSRVYDEIWVAGPAGRARYHAADVGIRDEDIVEVGRPQLDDLRVRAPAPAAYAEPTLLYAPTWEGWDDDQDYASHPTAGLALVRAATDAGNVRVVYRPHPFTGRRSPTVRRAHSRIVSLLHESSEGRRAAGRPAHEVMAPGTRDLYGCFAESDGIVTDVSSVLSDYLATGRPYAVTNPRGEAPEAFLRRFPAARAGTLLGPDGAGVAEFLSVLTGSGDDRLADARDALRRDVLGDASVPGQVRFQAAVSTLVARAEARATSSDDGAQRRRSGSR